MWVKDTVTLKECVELGKVLQEEIDVEAGGVGEFVGQIKVRIQSNCGCEEYDQAVELTVSSYFELSTTLGCLDMFRHNAYPFSEDDKIIINMSLYDRELSLHCEGSIGDNKVSKYLTLGILRLYCILKSEALIGELESNVGVVLVNKGVLDCDLIDKCYIDVDKLLVCKL